ncbi:hypothetical protein KEM48_007378 [Puccinia striiformis f. sp. tritici PST-130]|nr:hypothetical protein KEM48_007378 [Puccinia striiformis f. sp. tritici PST-130]
MGNLNPTGFIKPNLNEQAPACHSGDDVSQTLSIKIELRLALPSELSLTTNNQEAPTIILSSKDKDFKSSQFNKTIKSNLLDRITSTSQDLNRLYALYTSHKKNCFITSHCNV